MSAFIVSPAHINVIVTWANIYGGMRMTNREMAAQGRMLMAENCKSVGHRYASDKAAADAELSAYRFQPDAKGRSAVEIIKACQCLAYQSCEHDGWATSEAKRFLDGVESSAIRKLPGYSEAAWCID